MRRRLNASGDEIYERWVSTFERIENQTYTLFLYRDYWRGLGEITQANGNLPPSGIFDAFGVWYATTQATTMRRQVDTRRGTISFWRLLDDIARHLGVMTRERHVGLWQQNDGDEEIWGPEADRNYDRFARAANNTIPRPRTIADRDRLQELAEPVTRHVNEAIAHTADDERQDTPTYADLNAAIEEIGAMLQKYSSLLRATMLPILTPVHQYDWKVPFRMAWMVDDACPSWRCGCNGCNRRSFGFSRRSVARRGTA